MTEVYNRYRLDLKMWELLYQYGPFKFYLYRILSGAIMIFKISLWKIKPRSANYFQFRQMPKVNCDHLAEGVPLHELLNHRI